MAWLASLNWTTIGLLSASFLVIIFGFLRVEKRGRCISLLFLVAPMCYLIWIWVRQRQETAEMFIGLGFAALLYFLWYGFYGHRLPKPNSDNIKVWGQDD